MSVLRQGSSNTVQSGSFHTFHARSSSVVLLQHDRSHIDKFSGIGSKGGEGRSSYKNKRKLDHHPRQKGVTGQCASCVAMEVPLRDCFVCCQTGEGPFRLVHGDSDLLHASFKIIVLRMTRKLHRLVVRDIVQEDGLV